MVDRSDLPNIARRRKTLAACLTLLIGMIAGAGVWLATAPPGPGLDPDSASYLGAAEALADGRGYRVPIAHWTSRDSTAALAHFPPGYPTAIALPVSVGFPPKQAARLVNAIAAFLDIVVMVSLVTSVIGPIGGALLAAALLVMHPLVMVHLSVLSEPLFLASLACVLATMVVLSRARDARSQSRAVLLGGAAAAATVLIRYAGVAAVAAVVLWAVMCPAPLRTRLRRALGAVLPAFLLLGGWIVHAYLTSGSRSVRTLGVYGGWGDALQMGTSTIVAWLVPLTSDDTVPGRGWIALVLLIGLGIVICRGTRIAGQLPLAAIRATALLAILYLVVLVLSRWLADPAIPFDERILAPLFALVAVVVMITLPLSWRGARLPGRIICGTLLIAWLAASLRASEDDISWAMANGQDFALAQWSSSPLLAWAGAHASGMPVYTNWPPAVVFYLHRPAHEVPNDTTAALLRAFADTLRARHGVVLAFDQQNPDQIGPAELARATGLRQIVRVSDGIAFGPVSRASR